MIASTIMNQCQQLQSKRRQPQQPTQQYQRTRLVSSSFLLVFVAALFVGGTVVNGSSTQQRRVAVTWSESSWQSIRHRLKGERKLPDDIRRMRRLQQQRSQPHLPRTTNLRRVKEDETKPDTSKTTNAKEEKPVAAPSPTPPTSQAKKTQSLVDTLAGADDATGKKDQKEDGNHTIDETTTPVVGKTDDKKKDDDKGNGKKGKKDSNVIPLATFTIALDTSDTKDVTIADIEKVVQDYLTESMMISNGDALTIHGEALKDQTYKFTGSVTKATETESSLSSVSTSLSIQQSLLWRRQSNALADTDDELETALLTLLYGNSTSATTDSTTDGQNRTDPETTIHVVDVELTKLGLNGESDHDKNDKKNNHVLHPKEEEDDKDKFYLGEGIQLTTNHENVIEEGKIEKQHTLVAVIIAMNMLFATLLCCMCRFKSNAISPVLPSGHGRDHVPTKEELHQHYLTSMFKRKKHVKNSTKAVDGMKKRRHSHRKNAKSVSEALTAIIPASIFTSPTATMTLTTDSRIVHAGTDDTDDDVNHCVPKIETPTSSTATVSVATSSSDSNPSNHDNNNDDDIRLAAAIGEDTTSSDDSMDSVS